MNRFSEQFKGKRGTERSGKRMRAKIKRNTSQERIKVAGKTDLDDSAFCVKIVKKKKRGGGGVWGWGGGCFWVGGGGGFLVLGGGLVLCCGLFWGRGWCVICLGWGVGVGGGIVGVLCLGVMFCLGLGGGVCCGGLWCGGLGGVVFLGVFGLDFFFLWWGWCFVVFGRWG